jgi:hypothetical protein
MFFNLVVLLVANFISHTVPSCPIPSNCLPACLRASVGRCDCTVAVDIREGMATQWRDGTLQVAAITMMPVIAKVGSLMSPDHTITFVLSSVRLDAPCAFVFIATILSARRRADFFVVAPVQHGRVDVGSQAVQVLCDSAACGLPVSSFPNIMAYGITDSEGNQARPFKLCVSAA